MRKVISLTTIPPRLPLIEETLHSLDQQDVDCVYLNLPKFCLKTQSHYELPKWLLQSSWNRLIVNTCDMDYGPATKLVPTLFTETSDNTAILICDDDHSYHSDWSKQYFDNLEKGVFVCGNGASSICIERDLIQLYQLNPAQALAAEHLFAGRHFFFAEAFAGLAFHANVISPFELIESCNLSKESFFADDLTISFLLHKAGLKHKLIGLEQAMKSMSSMQHYEMPEWSLVSGNTGGNKQNYIAAFSRLHRIAHLVTALKDAK